MEGIEVLREDLNPQMALHLAKKYLDSGLYVTDRLETHGICHVVVTNPESKNPVTAAYITPTGAGLTNLDIEFLKDYHERIREITRDL